MVGDVDHGALMAALRQARAMGPDRAEQIDWMIRDDGWREAAEFAAGLCQTRALHLKPWQEPPCYADEGDPDERDRDAQALLRRMLAADVSRYHPDPLHALDEEVAERPCR